MLRTINCELSIIDFDLGGRWLTRSEEIKKINIKI